MIPRYGEPVDPAMRYTHRPGVYAILPRDGALLLTHQSEPYPEYQLPGGGIDPGEHPLPALRREVFEETGWRIGAARKVGTYRRFAYMPEYDIHAEKIAHIYLARPTSSLGPPLEDEHDAIWVPADIAADLVVDPGGAAMIRRVLAG